MTVVTGRIEPLKKIRRILNENGITRFNSIGEIRSFLKNYPLEKKMVTSSAEKSICDSITAIDEEIQYVSGKLSSSVIFKMFYFVRLKWLNYRRSFYKKNHNKIFTKRCEQLNKELDHAKNIVEELSTLIAGAIGENQVVEELRRLPDNYYLLNDFSMKFNPPIFYKEQRARIRSIQIDHLLIGRSGVFLIETKNWSKKSIESLDLRSPIDQIKRTSYALFILMHSEKNPTLTKHHWGSRKIPIRNLLVMTNEKPKEEFHHVKVLSLSELNSYVEYFPEILSDSEVKYISSYLGGRVGQKK